METLNVQKKCSYWSLNGTFTLSTVFVLLYCNYVAAQFSTSSTSPSGRPDNLQQDVSCGQLCHYDEWFRRAQCDERNLKTIPSSEGCENSHILELHRNQLTNISVTSFMDYSQIKTLDLSYNAITDISPGTFLNTTYLRYILIDNNYITELHNGTFKGTENHLRRVYLSRNNIVNIHENVFQGLRELTNIYLSYNQLQSLPPTVFHGLTTLKDILLGYNKLHHLDSTIFRDLVRLETLSLRNNKLTWLPNGLFQGLSSLREVVLSNNQLLTLPSPENLGIASIDTLCIDGNNLNKSDDVIPYTPITRDRLDIYGNPFTCDCAFTKIQEWYNNGSAENSNVYSVSCTLGDQKYHLNDELPTPCDHTTSNRMSSAEPGNQHPTKTIPPSTTAKTLPCEHGASEVTPSTNEIFSTNYYVCQRFQCNQNHREDKIFSLSLTSVVCISVFFISWICYTVTYCCCCPKGTPNRCI